MSYGNMQIWLSVIRICLLWILGWQWYLWGLCGARIVLYLDVCKASPYQLHSRPVLFSIHSWVIPSKFFKEYSRLQGPSQGLCNAGDQTYMPTSAKLICAHTGHFLFELVFSLPFPFVALWVQWLGSERSAVVPTHSLVPVLSVLWGHSLCLPSWSKAELLGPHLGHLGSIRDRTWGSMFASTSSHWAPPPMIKELRSRIKKKPPLDVRSQTPHVV